MTVVTFRSPYERKASDSYSPPPPPPPLDTPTTYGDMDGTSRDFLYLCTASPPPPPPPPPADPYSNYKYQADQTEYDDSNYGTGNANDGYGNDGGYNDANARKSVKPNDTVYASMSHYSNDLGENGGNGSNFLNDLSND